MTSRPLLFAGALLATCVPALAAEEPASGLRGVFEAHEKAFNHHDMEGVMKLYAPGDQTVMLGTGPGERWIGSGQIEDAYRHFFADFDPGTLQRSCPWMLSDVSGDVGWLSAACEYRDSLKGAHRAYALNISVVLQKMDGAWKLRTLHFSNLTAPQAK
jgi:ketosteroid isomerase-like protein